MNFQLNFREFKICLSACPGSQITAFTFGPFSKFNMKDKLSEDPRFRKPGHSLFFVSSTHNSFPEYNWAWDTKPGRLMGWKSKGWMVAEKHAKEKWVQLV